MVDGVALAGRGVRREQRPDPGAQGREGRDGVAARDRAAPARGQPAVPPHQITAKGEPRRAYTLSVRGLTAGPDEETSRTTSATPRRPLTGDHGTMHAAYAAGDVDCFAVEPQPDAQRSSSR